MDDEESSGVSDGTEDKSWKKVTFKKRRRR
jgi:hypothetical protein